VIGEQEVRVVNQWEEFEKRIRDRGVRVEERLRLLGLLREAAESQDASSKKAIVVQRKELLDAVGAAAQKIKEAL